MDEGHDDVLTSEKTKEATTVNSLKNHPIVCFSFAVSLWLGVNNCFYVGVVGKPQFTHMGEIVDGVDMRAEVALLSRNILIQGEMERSCYGNNWCQYYSHDTFGGHVKVRSDFSLSACRENTVRKHSMSRRICEGVGTTRLDVLCSHATLTRPGVLRDGDIFTLTEQFMKETPTPTGAVHQIMQMCTHISHTVDTKRERRETDFTSIPLQLLTLFIKVNWSSGSNPAQQNSTMCITCYKPALLHNTGSE